MDLCRAVVSIITAGHCLNQHWSRSLTAQRVCNAEIVSLPWRHHSHPLILIPWFHLTDLSRPHTTTKCSQILWLGHNTSSSQQQLDYCRVPLWWFNDRMWLPHIILRYVQESYVYIYRYHFFEIQKRYRGQLGSRRCVSLLIFITLWLNYRQTSNISRTWAGNKIVDHSDVVEASPVGAAPTTCPFLT